MFGSELNDAQQMTATHALLARAVTEGATEEAMESASIRVFTLLDLIPIMY